MPGTLDRWWIMYGGGGGGAVFNPILAQNEILIVICFSTTKGPMES